MLLRENWKIQNKVKKELGNEVSQFGFGFSIHGVRLCTD